MCLSELYSLFVVYIIKPSSTVIVALCLNIEKEVTWCCVVFQALAKKLLACKQKETDSSSNRSEMSNVNIIVRDHFSKLQLVFICK